MDKKAAEQLLEEFRSSEDIQRKVAMSMGYFAALCTANAMLKGFHEDEQFIRNCCEYGIFEYGTCRALDEGLPPPEYREKQLAWFDAQILQAELGRQASEVGEAVEAVRKPGPDHHCPEFSNFLVEEADVLIRIGDTCGKRGLPLGAAVVAKMLYNMNRPHKHGKNS